GRDAHLDANHEGQQLIDKRGVKDGKPASIYWYPTSTPKRPIELVVPGGRAHGFDLDGKSASRPDAMVDPETGQKVQNNVFRLEGCYALHNTNRSPEALDGRRAQVPAFLISVTGADLSKDGPVTVGFAQALQQSILGADGKPLQGQNFALDPSSR